MCRKETWRKGGRKRELIKGIENVLRSKRAFIELRKEWYVLFCAY